MVYFQVDDILPFHPRVIEAGNAAIGLWVRAGAWSSGHLTDGFIPLAVAKQLGKPAEIRRLVESGLWLSADGGYEFFRWHEDATGARRQFTKAEVEDRKRAARERKQSWREGRVTDASVPRDRTRDTTRDEHVSHASLAGAGSPAPAPAPAPAVPPSEEENDRPTPKVVVTVEQFERWWAIYPRRESKLKARDSYKTARLRGATIEELESGARRYRDDPNRDPAFTKIPTTWLNQGCWDDEPLPPREEAPKPTTPAAPPRRKFT